MDPETAERLLALNQRFYQTFATSFSATRRRLQPGVRQLIELFPAGGHLLDLGCGNGELARELDRRNWPGRYTGIDFAPALVKAETKEYDEWPIPLGHSLEIEWLEANLASPDWSNGMTPGYYEIITAFAVLHHLPGKVSRMNFLRQANKLLAPEGCFYISNWQFLHSPKLRARIQSWSLAEFDESRLDPGDYLIDWRSGGRGLRYVHHFTPQELLDLAEECGFKIVQTFLSDGQTGDLSIYQTWRLQA